MGATTPAISDYCIYTIRHTRDLEAAIQNGGRGIFTENTKWSRGYQLFQAKDQLDEQECWPSVSRLLHSIDRDLFL
jgi:hypothetical protein